MRIGLGLPNAMPESIDRGLLIDWARLGDEAGFEVLGVIDRPDYDSWEPLATLAGVATVTSQIRLATTILQLPNRNPVSVAKQAAVIDRSIGRKIRPRRRPWRSPLPPRSRNNARSVTRIVRPRRTCGMTPSRISSCACLLPIRSHAAVSATVSTRGRASTSDSFVRLLKNLPHASRSDAQSLC